MVLFSPFSTSTALDVGLISGGRPPYFWQNTSGQFEGIYIDLLTQISQKTGITFRYRDLPQPRIRLYMKYGELDLEPGIDPSWRQEKGEAESSIYSDVFLESPEILVFRPHLNIEKTGDNIALSHLVNCKVAGFNTIFKAASDLQTHTEKQILHLLQRGRCDYVMIPKLVFNYWLLDHTHDLTSSHNISIYQLRFRLTKAHQHEVSLINGAIQQLKTTGEIDKILHHYLSKAG